MTDERERRARAACPGRRSCRGRSTSRAPSSRRRATWPHALLIHGPRGIGKHALALNFAQALLCETPRADGLACGACAGCRYAVAGQHPDLMRLELLVIDPEEDTLEAVESIGIDRVRALTEFVQLTSHRQRAKVAVIAPAERMNAAAANALLKTLEEPPPGTYLILVSDQPGRMPATLRSRCRMLAAPLPDRADARAHGLPRRASRRPELALAQAAGAPLRALAQADPAVQEERRAWLAALAAPERLSVAEARGAHRRRRQGRAPGAPRARARMADRLDRGSRAHRRGRHRATEPRRRRAAAAPRGAGGAHRVVSLSSVVAAAARDAGASAAAASRRRGDAAGLPGPVLTMAENKPISAVPGAAMAAAGARPGVLSLNIRERAALYAAYMPFLKGGGIFIPTSRQYQLGEEVFMLLSLMDDPNRIAVQGRVVWITPEGVQGNRTQGIGVQFTQDETGATARSTIEQILGETLASVRPTHTM